MALLFQCTCSSSVQKGIIIAVIVIILLPVLNLAFADCKYTIKCNQQTSSTWLRFYKSCSYNYQPACKVCAQLVLRLLYIIHVCLSVHLHILLSTITSCTMLTCDFPLVDLMAALQYEYSTGIATMRCLALLRVLHTKDPRSKGNIHVRLTEVTRDAYRAANR